ncbi:hypothetical protein BDV12DRAFT_172700 [Aspergillus spectabilis]
MLCDEGLNMDACGGTIRGKRLSERGSRSGLEISNGFVSDTGASATVCAVVLTRSFSSSRAVSSKGDSSDEWMVPDDRTVLLAASSTWRSSDESAGSNDRSDASAAVRFGVRGLSSDVSRNGLLPVAAPLGVIGCRFGVRASRTHTGGHVAGPV